MLVISFMPSFYTACYMQPLLIRVLFWNAEFQLASIRYTVRQEYVSFQICFYCVTIYSQHNAPLHTKCDAYQYATSALFIHSVQHWVLPSIWELDQNMWGY